MPQPKVSTRPGQIETPPTRYDQSLLIPEVATIHREVLVDPCCGAGEAVDLSPLQADIDLLKSSRARYMLDNVPSDSDATFSDEFADGGSPDLAVRGWTVSGWATNDVSVRVGDINPDLQVELMAANTYRSTLIGGAIVIQAPGILYVHKPYAAVSESATFTMRGESIRSTGITGTTGSHCSIMMAAAAAPGAPGDQLRLGQEYGNLVDIQWASGNWLIQNTQSHPAQQHGIVMCMHKFTNGGYRPIISSPDGRLLYQNALTRPSNYTRCGFMVGSPTVYTPSFSVVHWIRRQPAGKWGVFHTPA